MDEKDLKNTDLFTQFNLVVDPGQAPLRLDKFIMNRIERASRNKVQNTITSGLATVNGKTVKSNYKVRPGEKIEIFWEKHRDSVSEILPEDLPLDVIYEDDDVLVINKAPGMVVHPGVGNKSGTLVNAVAHYLQKNNLPVMEGNDIDRPGLVHRIDKNTTGLMVMAKNSDAMTHLAAQFYDHSIERRYRALVWGNFDEPEGTIDEYLGRDLKDRKIMRVYGEDEGIGKHAITHYKVLKDYYYVSLIECKLETGRTHQIRAHMKHVGHNIFNDERYGGNRILKGTVYSKYKQFIHNAFDIAPRHILHAHTLGFVHPTTGEFMHFEQPLPEDFALLLEKWDNYLKTKTNK